LHIRAEYSVCDAIHLPMGLLRQVVKQAPSFSRFGGRSKTWPVAAVGIGGEGELGNKQKATASLTYIEIHPPRTVRENPVSQYALQQPVGLFLAVAAFNANQGKNPFSGFTRQFSINMNCGFGYSL